MFKIHRGLSPEILRETFASKTSSYNFYRNNTFESRHFVAVLNWYRFKVQKQQPRPESN